MDLPIRYEDLPEPPNLGLYPKNAEGKLLWYVNADGRDFEVISVRLDEVAQLPLMPTWLFLRIGSAQTLLLHTCGNGSGWREVDEGAGGLRGHAGLHFVAFMPLPAPAAQGRAPWRKTPP